MESESSSTLTEVFSLIWEVWKQRWLRKTVSKMSLTPSLKAFLQRGSAHKPLQILHHSFFIFTISHQTQKQATTDPSCEIALHTISWAFFTRCSAQKIASSSICQKKKNQHHSLRHSWKAVRPMNFLHLFPPLFQFYNYKYFTSKMRLHLLRPFWEEVGLRNWCQISQSNWINGWLQKKKCNLSPNCQKSALPNSSRPSCKGVGTTNWLHFHSPIL